VFVGVMIMKNWFLEVFGGLIEVLVIVIMLFV